MLRLLAQGHSYADITAHLTLSPHTVHAHLRTIYSKIGATSRTDV